MRGVVVEPWFDGRRLYRGGDVIEITSATPLHRVRVIDGPPPAPASVPEGNAPPVRAPRKRRKRADIDG